jgi:DNA polymerase V
MGIVTALDLARTHPAFIRKYFSMILERTGRELNGESCINLEEDPLLSSSFGSRITEYESMRQAICQYAQRAGEKLRPEKQFTRHIGVFIKTYPFVEDEVYYGNVTIEKLLLPTRDTGDLPPGLDTTLT